MPLFVLMLAALPTQAAAYVKDLGVGHYPQDEDCYCGVAVLQMYSYWLEGDYYDQEDIEDDMDAEFGADVCGSGSGEGIQWEEMKDGLEYYTSRYFTKYDRGDHNTFTTKIITEVYSGEPVAVVADTLDWRKTVTGTNSHWIIVDGFKNTSSSYSSSASKLSGFYVLDPLYGSGFTDYYTSLAPGTMVSKTFFYTTFVSPVTSSKQYSMVHD